MAATLDWGPSRNKTTTWFDPSITATARATMSGLEFLRALRDGNLPAPPIASLLNFRPLEVEVGRVVFVGAPDESAYNPIGLVHGGWVCTLADTVAACAVHSTLGVGVGYTSIDLDLKYLRPLTSDSGELRATGEVIKPGRRVSVATAVVHDQRGKLVATATSSCLLMPTDR